VSYILTGLDGFTTAAGYVGPRCRVDHDVSLLIPEVWCRLRPHERNAKFLIENDCLERMKDFDHNGKRVLASRLGWRITSHFVGQFFGRVFDNPIAVFPDEMLKPETQDLAEFVDGVNNITEAQQRVAQVYLDDGSVNDLCPQLQALIHIMAKGTWNGVGVDDPALRSMFTREHLLSSEWYQLRLARQQRNELRLLKRHEEYLHHRNEQVAGSPEAGERVADCVQWVHGERARVSAADYIQSLVGTIGADAITE
jgi:hypothetical protein